MTHRNCNQWYHNCPKSWRKDPKVTVSVLVTIGFIVFTLLVLFQHLAWRPFWSHFQPVQLISPIKANAFAETIEVAGSSATLNDTPTKAEINAYIKDVFGKDYDTAINLLTNPKCHENGNLNPNAVNDNTTWGGVGRDIGVFQINDTWQKTQDKFLFNYKINVQIAKQLFDENGGHFNLWSCGKYLGI